MKHCACPFEEGDWIDHKKFGFGTVSGAPVAMMRGGPRGSKPAGWQIPVRWDDPSRTADRVGSDFLTKVSSPDARPFTYWNQQWQALFKNWLNARRNLEEASKQFRPAPKASVLQALTDAEAKALAVLDAFRADEAARVACLEPDQRIS